jgi:hypothetical protein
MNSVALTNGLIITTAIMVMLNKWAHFHLICLLSTLNLWGTHIICGTLPVKYKLMLLILPGMVFNITVFHQTPTLAHFLNIKLLASQMMGAQDKVFASILILQQSKQASLSLDFSMSLGLFKN